MIKGKKVIAIVPARGGSKRLPKKNILDFYGKPLINWSIEAGLGSKYIDWVIVSTDDIEIADIAREAGGDVPFLRPRELTSDNASTVDVIVHLLGTVGSHEYDYIVLLQPTSPLRTSAHVDEALELLASKDADAIVSVSPVEHPVEWTNTLPENHSLDDFLTESILNVRSQDLPERYQINGAIYIAKTDKFLAEKSLFLRQKTYAYIMRKKESVDIDDKIDFAKALALKIGYSQVLINDAILKEISKAIDEKGAINLTRKDLDDLYLKIESR